MKFFDVKSHPSGCTNNYFMDHRELLSIIDLTIERTAVAVMEMYKTYGELISRSDIIREIGNSLYREGVEDGHLNPFRNNNTIKGKVWVKTSEYITYKRILFKQHKNYMPPSKRRV
jgi:hypothetical protein